MLFTRRNQANRKLKKVLIFVIGFYIMIGTSLYVLQEKILFRPTVLNKEYLFNFNNDFEELNLSTEKGAEINAIHFKVENPKGVILYFHGNAGDLSRWGNITEYFVDLGYDLLVMDYRTYGKSTGKLSEQALFNDAQFCYDFLKSLYNEADISVYGRSLGTGIATYIGSKNSPKQVILETPYFNIIDVAKHRFPLLPIKYMLHYKIMSNEFIQNVDCPISIIHGTEDSVVPFSSGKKLSQVAPPGGVEFNAVEGGEHNNLISFDVYHDFINRVLP
jgi:alpha-beta hydrolase superfamily lysophospholipase